MAEGLAVAKANAILSAIFQNIPYSETALWAQLHIGAPGPAGTANPAQNTTRIVATNAFGAAPSAGSIVSDAELLWSDVADAEDYSHITLHTAETAGAFICSGVITANAVAVGDNFSIPAGEVAVTFPVAS